MFPIFAKILSFKFSKLMRKGIMVVCYNGAWRGVFVNKQKNLCLLRLINANFIVVRHTYFGRDVCMYVCVYVCVYVFRYMYVCYVCMHVCTVCMYVCINAYIHNIHTYIWRQVNDSFPRSILPSFWSFVRTYIVSHFRYYGSQSGKSRKPSIEFWQ